METMRQYVVRRAFETKKYRLVAEETDVGYEWLRKLALNQIPNPGADKIENLYRYYKLQEAVHRRRK
jgi:hypothetical protein